MVVSPSAVSHVNEWHREGIGSLGLRLAVVHI